MSNKFYYSRYSKVFSKNDVYAYYHSLRLKPLYVNGKYHKMVEKLAQKTDLDLVLKEIDEGDEGTFLQVVDQLVQYKIFSNEESFDNKIITKFRNGLPKPYIQIAYFVMTEICNLACSYCFIENNMKSDCNREKIMTKEMVRKGLDFFCKQIKTESELFNEEKTIIIYGGEPLTNFENVKYLIKLIDEYKRIGNLPQKTSVSMITNGTLLSDEIARYLKEANISIAVSLDGMDTNCNSCRKYAGGKEAFEDIIKGIMTARNAGCECGLSMTLTEETIKDFSKIENVVETYGISSLGFNILMTDENFSVADDYNEKASDFIIHAFEYFREKGIYEDRIMRKAKAFVDSKVYLYDCGALGGNQIVIAPNGDVGICHGYLHNREYFTTNVDDMQFSAKDNEVYKEWNRRTPICMEECEECEALGICGGGCPLNARNNGENKSIWDLDKRFCVHAKKTLEWLIWDLYDKITKK